MEEWVEDYLELDSVSEGSLSHGEPGRAELEKAIEALASSKEGCHPTRGHRGSETGSASAGEKVLYHRTRRMLRSSSWSSRIPTSGIHSGYPTKTEVTGCPSWTAVWFQVNRQQDKNLPDISRRNAVNRRGPCTWPLLMSAKPSNSAGLNCSRS